MIRLTDYPLPGRYGRGYAVPGSRLARRRGCTCPVQPLADVAWQMPARSLTVAVRDGCPLHHGTNGRTDAGGHLSPKGRRPDRVSDRTA